MSRSFSTRWFKVQPDEVGALAWSCAYFFCLLGGWYILRPLRDAMGAAGGIDNLKWLYLGTLGSMLVATVAFGAITMRFPRRKFIPIVYRFFIVNLLIFFVLLKVLPESSRVNLGRVFFVWASVYNLFIVSVFWSFMADLFTNPQGKRLFPFIAVGGTLGHIFGSFVAERLAEPCGADNLLLVTVALLEVACWCVYRLARAPQQPSSSGAGTAPPATAPLGGGPLAGASRVIRSPYLAGICLFVFCYTLTSTFLEITKLDIGLQQSADQDARVAFFANIDFWTGVVTVLAQVFLTARLIARFGVGLTLGLLPVVTLLGFVALGVSFARLGPEVVVPVLVMFMAARRATNYAVSRPAREVLYTVVSREDKFKSKNFIDTFVYRFGDQIGVWLYPVLKMLGATAVSFTAVPLAVGWFVVAVVLGRKQRLLASP
ncbi:MAG: NTP/NDP exchange transporter [Planctomycetota bacterium]|jgi:AAA family ATP:ADP antiporter